MREIEFRIYNKKTKKMESVWSIDNARNLINDEQSYYFINSIHEKKSELMQYTSLKDKKGVEIYENDIVKTKIGVMDFVLKVVFENGKFMAVCDDDDLTAFDLFTIADKCEVIGNIYENSELLK